MNEHIVVFNAKWWVRYGQAYVLSPDCDPIYPEEAFVGQKNGLCGAATPGGLFVAFGVNLGPVHLRVEVHTAEPPVALEWDEIIEVSCIFPRAPVVLEDWAGDRKVDLGLSPGTYRVRHCAKRFGEAPDADEADEASLEQHALHFWPSPMRSDLVIKETSATAALLNGGAWLKKPQA